MLLDQPKTEIFRSEVRHDKNMFNNLCMGGEPAAVGVNHDNRACGRETDFESIKAFS